jgi:hypothetical protein
MRRTFEPGTDHGGEDGGDGRAFRYLGSMGSGPGGYDHIVDYAFLPGDANGDVRVVHDRLSKTVPSAAWMRLFDHGLAVTSEIEHGKGRFSASAQAMTRCRFAERRDFHSAACG